MENIGNARQPTAALLLATPHARTLLLFLLLRAVWRVALLL
jgi:hypothetical protein